MRRYDPRAPHDRRSRSGKSEWESIMQVRKSLKIPVHYATTKSKISKLDDLTARITYCIMRISEYITDETKTHFVVHWHLAGKRGRLVYRQFADTSCDIVGQESTAPHLKPLRSILKQG